MGINYLEKQYLLDSLFLREECLEINYLPDTFLHREQELIMLSKIFIRLIEKPFLISRKVLIQGAIGIGKTLITKKFGQMLLNSAQKRSLNFYYVHINCRIEKTNYKVMHKILSDLNNQIPKRGFSPQDLISVLQDFLIKNNAYILLVLDELNHLQIKQFNLIYALTRLNETNKNQRNYLSMITIVRDITLLNNLDKSTISTLQGNILTFKKYRNNQIFDILKERVKLALVEKTFPDKLIRYIADKIVDSGDIRKGMVIIRNSVKIAETKDHKKVILEDVHQALSNLIPSLQDNFLEILNKHQILLLLSIVQLIQEINGEETNLKEIKQRYSVLCNKYGENPRQHTQIWQYLQNLKNYDFIYIENRSKDVKGRKSFIQVKSIPVPLLKSKLIDILNNISGLRRNAAE